MEGAKTKHYQTKTLNPTEASRVRPGPGCRAATASGAVPLELSRQAKKLMIRRLLRS
jgi:hypothetical protein